MGPSVSKRKVSSCCSMLLLSLKLCDCVGVYALPERRGCLHIVSRGLRSEVYSGSTSHTPEALLSVNIKICLSDES